MYSPHDRDQIFNSLGSTDALQWRGVSIGMPHSPADRVKAFKHAGYSSMQADLAQACVITLLLLPVNANHRDGFATHLTRLGDPCGTAAIQAVLQHSGLRSGTRIHSPT
jgi:hypothetical protein